ncbi:hypothetical protein VTN02DRAFT_6542 [Thermoascus thermophilus]
MASRRWPATESTGAVKARVMWPGSSRTPDLQRRPIVCARPMPGCGLRRLIPGILRPTEHDLHSCRSLRLPPSRHAAPDSVLGGSPPPPKSGVGILGKHYDDEVGWGLLPFGIKTWLALRLVLTPSRAPLGL